MRKRNDPFYGQDSGASLSEEARDEIEHGDEGAGHKGNSVDIAQRYAASESDEYTEQAERMTRDMERGAFKHSGQFADPEKRREFVESLAESLRGRPATPAQQPAQRPKSQRERDDEFWASDEPKKQMPKRL